MPIPSTTPRAALGHPFRVTTPNADLTAYIDELFADLPEAGDPCEVHTYDINGPDARGLWTARKDDRVIESPGAAARAFGLVLWELNRSVISDTREPLLLHAGGVQLDGQGIVLPGEMEAGKSTLTAGLVRAGARYLSDEVVAVDADGARLEGFARPISLDPGSWELFPEVASALPAELEPWMSAQWQVTARSLGSAVAAAPVTPALVVFPRFEADVPTQARELRGAEALLRLSACVFPTNRPRAQILRTLANVLNSTRCFELRGGSLSASVEAVVELTQLPEECAAGGEAAACAAMAKMDPPTRSSDGRAANIIDSSGSAVLAPRRSEAVSSLVVQDDCVLHLPSTDELLRLNPIAELVWERLDGTRTVRSIVDELRRLHPGLPADLEAQVCGFITELTEVGAAVPGAAAG